MRSTISSDDTPRDSRRLFAKSEEVCRYKYNAFLSHRSARCATGGWLNGIWNRRPFTRLRDASRRGRWWLGVLTTPISISWNLPQIYNSFRGAMSAHGACVPQVSPSNRPSFRPSRSPLFFHRRPPPSVENHVQNLKNWEKTRRVMKSNVFSFPRVIYSQLMFKMRTIKFILELIIYILLTNAGNFHFYN